MATRKGPKRAPKAKGAPKEILIAPLPDAERIANELIPKHHTHLADARIDYLSTTAKRKKCDRVRLGSAQKIAGLTKYYAKASSSSGRPADFVVLISLGDWAWLPEEQRRALVDHELAHCWRQVDDKGRERWALRGHDVEEFVEIIARHGLWRREHQEIADVIRQLPLEARAGAAAPFVPEGEKETAAVNGVAERVVETADRLAHGDREGVSAEAADAWDRLAATGATVHAGSAVPA